MATPSIRGHQGTLKLYQDGGEIQVFTITRASVNQETSFSRAFYVGARFPEGDQSLDGWTGDIEMEVKGPEIDEFMDALQSSNLAGIGVSDYALVLNEFYADGQSKSYVYFDCQFRLSKTIAGMNEKVMKTYEFQASGRQAVN
jgi:hypothetical protein